MLPVDDRLCFCENPIETVVVPQKKDAPKKKKKKTERPQRTIIKSIELWHGNEWLRKFAEPTLRPRRGPFDDELDFVIASTYQHDLDYFPEKVDVYMQPATFKSSMKGSKVSKSHTFGSSGLERSHRHGKKGIPVDHFGGHQPTVYVKGHPLIIGGISERVHPSYVKLMNSSHHSPQTNAGYIRQDRDGNVFHY